MEARATGSKPANLTHREAAAFLRIHTKTLSRIRQWAREPAAHPREAEMMAVLNPSEACRGRWLYPVENLRRWLELNSFNGLAADAAPGGASRPVMCDPPRRGVRPRVRFIDSNSIIAQGRNSDHAKKRANSHGNSPQKS